MYNVHLQVLDGKKGLSFKYQPQFCFRLPKFCQLAPTQIAQISAGGFFSSNHVAQSKQQSALLIDQATDGEGGC